MRRKLSRREIDRLENLLILLLVCLALFLIHRTGMFQSVTEQGSGTGDESLFAGVQDTALSRGTPVRLMVQNGTGRYGVQYDQTTVNRLYHDGLNDLLTQSLDTMASPQASSREAWERAVSQGSSWVYYDFLYNVSFTSQSSRGEGEARSFLITARNGRADALYYYNEETGDYYMAQLREASLVLPALLEDLVPNGGQFAFENSSLADTLAPYMMLLPQPPLCPVYTGANPLDVIRNYGPAYITAVGTMSSAATLAVALRCAKKSQPPLRDDMVDFGIPLFANIHLCGSVLTEVFFVMTVNKILYGSIPAMGTMVLFCALLGIFAIGAPGVPGGTVMASLGLITGVLGFEESGTALMLTIFALQDSFGTACNVTGDGALTMILTGFAQKHGIKRQKLESGL